MDLRNKQTLGLRFATLQDASGPFLKHFTLRRVRKGVALKCISQYPITSTLASRLLMCQTGVLGITSLKRDSAVYHVLKSPSNMGIKNTLK